jgi:lipopolysaccharide export system protein LptA
MKSIDETPTPYPHARRLPVMWALSLAVLALALISGEAAARKSDRDLPLDIEADALDGTLDEDGTANLKGNVHITQGTMDVYADLATITRVAGDFNRVVFQGKPAKLNQINDDGTQMRAQAQRIDYNVDTDIVVLTGAVVVEQERGTLRGERVTYNLTSGELDSGGNGGRIQMKILPKDKTASKEGG